MNTTVTDDTIIRGDEVAKMLGVSGQTWRPWRKLGLGPTVIQLGPRAIGCRVADIKSFLASRARV